MDSLCVAYWQNIAASLAEGKTELTKSDLLALGHNLDVLNLRHDFLPLGIGSEESEERSYRVFDLVQRLWGLTPNQWLEKGLAWIDESRKASEGYRQDNLGIKDVVSAEILVRLLGATWLVCNLNTAGGEAISLDGKELLSDETILSVNLFLRGVCFKGRTRTQRCGSRSVYATLWFSGLVPHASGRFLPSPETSLPELFSMLNKEKICKKAYR